ncbi:hypothetical protein JCM16358_12570 [Halanaerocella petrolearia]
MLRDYNQFIAVVLLVFISVTFIGADYAQAQAGAKFDFGSDNETLKKVGIGGIIVLGIMGIVNLVRKHKEEEYQGHLKRGKMYLEQEDYDEAINNLSQAQDVKDTIEVERLLHKARSKYQKKHYQLGNQYLEEGNWELAYHEFEKVKRYGSYLDTQQKYNQAYRHLRELKLKRIAVVEFEDSSYGYGNLGQRATSLFTAQLLDKNPKFIEVIEREQLNEVLEEQKLGASGLIDSSTAKDIGNIMGVDYLVVGEVISGDVSENKDSEWVDVYYSDEEKRRYTVQKVAYTQIFFKLLKVSDGSVVLSKRVKKKVKYEDSYYEGDSVVVPSDNELMDEALTNTVDSFARQIYNKYEL